MPPQPTLWKRIGYAFLAGPIKVLLIVVCSGMLFSLLYIPPRPRGNVLRASCQSNLKQIALIALHYREDYEAYPLASNPPNSSWRKLYASLIIESQLFRCRSDGNTTDADPNSYGYNANLSGNKIGDGKSVVFTILNFEVEASANNKTQTGKTLAAVTAKERHLEGANYSFADGHVKWLKPERVNGAKPDGKNVTFAVK